MLILTAALLQFWVDPDACVVPYFSLHVNTSHYITLFLVFVGAVGSYDKGVLSFITSHAFIVCRGHRGIGQVVCQFGTYLSILFRNPRFTDVCLHS